MLRSFLILRFTTTNNMKIYFVAIIFLACTSPVFAQSTYLDKVADDACRCFETAKDKIKNEADFNKAAENCISTAMMPYLDSFSKDENVPVEELDKEVGAKIGQKMGVKLAKSCPVFLQLVTDYALDKEEDDIVTGTATGLITAVHITDHVYLDIKGSSGKITKVVWLHYFPGADDYKSSPARLKGKKVEVEWLEQEIYFIAKKDFGLVKAISKLGIK